jgi:phospholipid/cholesterol/gamma-HCH transport system substrate-binding protein
MVMVKKGVMELSVGFFMLVGILALVMLAFQVSGLTHYMGNQGYYVTAIFDNIGDLKVRAPVTVSGVRIGQVTDIQLNPQTYQANVRFFIENKNKYIPSDSSARILTQGLLGSNYISIDPGFQNVFLKNGDKMTSTQSALILENLIGQLLFKVSGTESTKPSVQSKRH